jgi:hypothetical protein
VTKRDGRLRSGRRLACRVPDGFVGSNVIYSSQRPGNANQDGDTSVHQRGGRLRGRCRIRNQSSEGGGRCDRSRRAVSRRVRGVTVTQPWPRCRRSHNRRGPPYGPIDLYDQFRSALDRSLGAVSGLSFKSPQKVTDPPKQFSRPSRSETSKAPSGVRSEGSPPRVPASQILEGSVRSGTEARATPVSGLDIPGGRCTVLNHSSEAGTRHATRRPDRSLPARFVTLCPRLDSRLEVLGHSASQWGVVPTHAHVEGLCAVM